MFVLCIGLGYITLSIEELDMRDAMPLVAKGRAKLGKKRNFVRRKPLKQGAHLTQFSEQTVVDTTKLTYW